MTSGRIWLISGIPGAGKTTIERAVCARYSNAIHIPVDDLREFVVTGHALPIEWTHETTRQFALARGSAARMAADYSDEGFAVVIDDVMREEDIDQFTRHLSGRPLTKVALIPRLDVALARNRDRTNKSLTPASLSRSLGGSTDRWWRAAAQTPAGSRSTRATWTWQRVSRRYCAARTADRSSQRPLRERSVQQHFVAALVRDVELRADARQMHP